MKTDEWPSRLDRLDTTVFDAIETQTSENDRKSLLACQRAVRSMSSDYAYLEVGSYLGGSLVPHLFDDSCCRIYSVDRRTESQPDERGVPFHYPGNSTELMLAGLRRLDAERVGKIVCFDAATTDVPGASLDPRPSLFFVDGEHTDRAVIRDFEFCWYVLTGGSLSDFEPAQVGTPGAAILFHDSAIVYNALGQIVRSLVQWGIRFHAYNLPDSLFVIELHDYPLHDDPEIRRLLIDNHVGYLSGLRSNDLYRRFYNRLPLRVLRRCRNRLLALRGRKEARAAP